MMPKLLIIKILTLLFLTQQAYSQPMMVKISGVVSDGENGMALPGANILFKDAGAGISADAEGMFVISIPKGNYTLMVSYIGYQTYVENFVADTDKTIKIIISPEVITTEEVVITGNRPQENILKMVDNISLNRDEINAAPQLFGQTDIIKTLQMLPGVQGNGEGNTGIYVRGGAIDQNLIVLDHAPVYNTGHLFGFFSLFNPSGISDVELIKGGIPASWGGRLSSVLKIESRSGSFEEFKGEAGIGLISGDIVIEGPLKKQKSSFILTARRTYIDLISKAITGDPTIFNTGLDYYFDDVNAKLDFKISEKNRISLSGYTGNDDFLFQGKNSLKNTIRWQNTTGSIIWDHYYNDRFYHNSIFYTSKYRLNFSAGINNYLFKMSSFIKDTGIKQQWTLSGKRGQLEFGGELIYHQLEPNNMQAKTEDVDFKFSNQETLKSLEEAAYISGEHQVSKNLKFAAGIRFSFYQQLGPFTRYKIDESMTILDTTFYGNNKIIHTDSHLEPRFSARYQTSRSSSIKISYDRMAQYLHMAPVTSISLPTDVWVSGSEKIKPQLSDQYSLGYFRNFDDNKSETSASVYFKSMKNQIEYRDGVIVGYSKGYNYDDNFIFGTGRAYGLELFIKKNSGRLNGWISYTLSRTEKTLDEINSGRTFASKYDRLHNVSVVNSYSLNRKWSCSVVFVYSTGNTLTLPVGRYIINGNIINEYAGRNTFRMPSYHRIDISAKYILHDSDKNKSELVFSVYNLYNRKNPYYVYLQTDGSVDDYYLNVELKKVSLFPILPAVSWRLYF